MLKILTCVIFIVLSGCHSDKKSIIKLPMNRNKFRTGQPRDYNMNTLGMFKARFEKAGKN
jgi:hypothetical protein